MDIVLEQLGADALVYPVSEKGTAWLQEHASYARHQFHWPIITCTPPSLFRLIPAMLQAGLEPTWRGHRL